MSGAESQRLLSIAPWACRLGHWLNGVTVLYPN